MQACACKNKKRAHAKKLISRRMPNVHVSHVSIGTAACKKKSIEFSNVKMRIYEFSFLCKMKFPKKASFPKLTSSIKQEEGSCPLGQGISCSPYLTPRNSSQDHVWTSTPPMRSIRRRSARRQDEDTYKYIWSTPKVVPLSRCTNDFQGAMSKRGEAAKHRQSPIAPSPRAVAMARGLLGDASPKGPGLTWIPNWKSSENWETTSRSSPKKNPGSMSVSTEDCRPFPRLCLNREARNPASDGSGDQPELGKREPPSELRPITISIRVTRDGLTVTHSNPFASSMTCEVTYSNSANGSEYLIVTRTESNTKAE